VNPHIDVIATTISGSMSDWKKVERIEPLFRTHGFDDLSLVTADSHAEARARTAELVRNGSRLLISAGGSGTFNSVLEGCHDAGVDMAEVTLGFLRKGSADLIGKVLGMPDKIEEAVSVFAHAIRDNRTVPCDILAGVSAEGDTPVRHFVGYGGAEVFGEIPRFTENRFVKYYKGVLSQCFGDLGPFFVGTQLALASRLIRQALRGARWWTIAVDGAVVSEGRFQSMVIVNGDLGPDLPYAKSVPLGSGDFYLFGIRDIGVWRLIPQLKRAWDASILKEPQRWGFESFRVERELVISPLDDATFPVNFDGSAITCRGSVRVWIASRTNLLSR